MVKEDYLYHDGVCSGSTVAGLLRRYEEERRQKVCYQVAEAIGELQSIELELPGSIGGGRSQGPWLSESEAGPFETVRELEDWFTRKLNLCKKMNKAHQDVPPFTGRFGKLVMSHMDISTRTIIIEDCETICLIECEFAGAYPLHFETAALKKQSHSKNFYFRILSSIESYAQDVKSMRSTMWAIVSSPEC